MRYDENDSTRKKGSDLMRVRYTCNFDRDRMGISDLDCHTHFYTRFSTSLPFVGWFLWPYGWGVAANICTTLSKGLPKKGRVIDFMDNGFCIDWYFSALLCICVRVIENDLSCNEAEQNWFLGITLVNFIDQCLILMHYYLF